MQTFVSARGIRILLHCTWVNSRPSILEHGIIAHSAPIAGRFPSSPTTRPVAIATWTQATLPIDLPNSHLFGLLTCDHPHVEWAW